MYQKSVIHYMTKVCIDFLFFIGILCCILVPFMSHKVFSYLNVATEMLTFATIILLASGLVCVYILWQLKVIFKTLMNGNPFIHANVSCLRKIAMSCLAISFIFVVKMVVLPTISTIVIIAIFIVGCLLCLTLKDLFKQSIYYKDENDLTV